MTIEDTVVSNQLQWKVYVEERWYLWPYAYVTFADPTINDWLEHRRLNRLTLHAGIAHTNFTGYNDKAYLGIRYGYREAITLGYMRPFLFPKQQWDILLESEWVRQRELITSTQNGEIIRPQFYPNYAITYFFSRVALRKRFSQYHFLYVRPSYRQVSIHDSVLYYNPLFLGEKQKTSIRYTNIEIRLKWDERNIRPYPTKGYKMELSASLNSLGFSKSFFSYNFFHEFSRRWYWAAGLYIAQLWGKKVPYFEKLRLSKTAYGLRGFQRYYIDGTFLAVVKTEWKFAVVPWQLFHWKRLPRYFRTFPFGCYLYLFGDAGYIEDRSNTNFDDFYKKRFLGGYGIGIDLVTFYDIVFRVELIRNHLGVWDWLFQAELAIR